MVRQSPGTMAGNMLVPRATNLISEDRSKVSAASSSRIFPVKSAGTLRRRNFTAGQRHGFKHALVLENGLGVRPLLLGVVCIVGFGIPGFSRPSSVHLRAAWGYVGVLAELYRTMPRGED